MDEGRAESWVRYAVLHDLNPDSSLNKNKEWVKAQRGALAVYLSDYLYKKKNLD